MLLMKLPTAIERGILMDLNSHSPQATGNLPPGRRGITHKIPQRRSGSVRLNNFVSQNYSLPNLTYDAAS